MLHPLGSLGLDKTTPFPKNPVSKPPPAPIHTQANPPPRAVAVSDSGAAIPGTARTGSATAGGVANPKPHARPPSAPVRPTGSLQAADAPPPPPPPSPPPPSIPESPTPAPSPTLATVPVGSASEPAHSGSEPAHSGSGSGPGSRRVPHIGGLAVSLSFLLEFAEAHVPPDMPTW